MSFIFSLFTLVQLLGQSIGFKIGGMASGFVYTDQPSNISTQFNHLGEGRFAGLAGLYGNFEIIKKLELQPELLFTLKGDKDIHANYLELPILLKYRIIDEISVGAGPGLALLTNLNGIADNRFDLTANIDMAYTLQKKLDIGFRTCYGFISALQVTYADNYGNAIADSGMQNWYCAIYAGYQFNLKRAAKPAQ